MFARRSRVELIVIDERGYVPLVEVAAELLFQVIAERAEKAAIIVTTNLPSQQGLARPAYRSGTHHRDGLRVVSLS
jgi:DNA replication protein DnaC